jgi:hypothetical protein
MHIDLLNYLPLAGPFFLLPLSVLLFVIVLIHARALRYAYNRMGISSGACFCSWDRCWAAISMCR